MSLATNGAVVSAGDVLRCRNVENDTVGTFRYLWICLSSSSVDCSEGGKCSPPTEGVVVVHRPVTVGKKGNGPHPSWQVRGNRRMSEIVIYLASWRHRHRPNHHRHVHQAHNQPLTGDQCYQSALVGRFEDDQLVVVCSVVDVVVVGTGLALKVISHE